MASKNETTAKRIQAAAKKRAAAKKPAAPASPKGSIADRIRLGEDAYAVKQQAKPKEWRQIVKAAHAKGYTVSSALSNTPDDLKARTHSSLKREADTQVAAAYDPQAKELEYQTGIANNIRTKRTSDEAAYNQWASQEMSKIAQASQKAQIDFQTFVDTQATNAKTTADNLLATATGQSTGAGTATTDQSQSVQLAGLKERLGAQAQQTANQAAAAHAAEPMAAERGAAIQASQMGAHNQVTASIEGDWGKALRDIGASKLKLDSDRAGATIKTYSDLLGREVDKANANRDSDALSASLDEKAATRKQDYQKFLIGNATTVRGQNKAANTTRRGQDKAAATAHRGQTLSSDDRAADRRARSKNSGLDRASRESIAATNAASKAAGDVNKRATANTKVVAVVDTIADILKTQQRGKAGKKGGSGYLWDPDEQKWIPARQALINRGATTPQINAGLAHARGQLLTPAQKAALGIVG